MTSSVLSSSQFKDPQTDENNNPKSKDCLSVKPARELNFMHSKNRYTADLQLTNRKGEPVLYKIRTTAAKSYMVLPTVGLIPPYGTASIKIHMPTREQTKERLSDKFLIQAFPYTRNDLGDDTKIMNQVFEQYCKVLSSKEFQSTKLRVYFESHTIIEEDVSEETGSVKHYSPSTTMNRDAAESSSALFASRPEKSPPSSLKRLAESMKTVPTPQPEVISKPEAKSYDLFTQVLKDDTNSSFRDLSNSKSKLDSHSFRNTTPEPYPRQVSFELPAQVLKEDTNSSCRESYNSQPEPLARQFTFQQQSKTSDPEGATLSSQRESESLRVSRSLKNELDQDLMRRNSSTSNMTNTKSFNSFNDNDVSIHSEISDVKSNMSFNEQLAAYKYKLDLLERKYNDQNTQMSRLLQEREVHQQEAQNLRRAPVSLSTTADESRLEQNNKSQMEVWHLMILCVVCMILGSIFR